MSTFHARVSEVTIEMDGLHITKLDLDPDMVLENNKGKQQ